MKISVSADSVAMGKAAAERIAAELRDLTQAKGYARIVLSTGASQFEMFEALVQQDVEWGKVEMFHLDEYIGIPETHGASFRKYLKERFVSRVPLMKANFVAPDGDVGAAIANIGARLLEKPVDIGVIGIGENGHIAFNDPPADFLTTAPYIVVNLDDNCKKQQMGEGWFPTMDDVPKQAVSMSVYQIMQSRSIISVVPHKVKAKAVLGALTLPVTNTHPSTMMKMHPDWKLFLDADSASLLDMDAFKEFVI